MKPQRLHEVAIARSGDKGNRATLSVVALNPADYAALERWLEADVVRAAYAGIVQGAVVRHTLPQLSALQFTLDGALGGGVTRSLALDAHGKTLASVLLALPLPPDEAGWLGP